MAIPGATAPAQALRGRGTIGRRRQGSDARVPAANHRRAAREPHPDPRRMRTAPSCHRRQEQTLLLAATPDTLSKPQFPHLGKGPAPPSTPSLSPFAFSRRSAGEKAEKTPTKRSGAPHLPRPVAGPRRPPPPSQAGDGEREGTPTLTVNRRRRRVGRPERARPPGRGGE